MRSRRCDVIETRERGYYHIYMKLREQYHDVSRGLLGASNDRRSGLLTGVNMGGGLYDLIPFVKNYIIWD